MTGSVGFLDRLFGKRVELDLPQPDGTTLHVSVTQAWLNKMIAEGKISRSEQLDPIEKAKTIQDACDAAFEQARLRVTQLLTGRKRRSMLFWLADFPQVYFHEVFSVDSAGDSYVPVLTHAELADGAACAAITQAYSLWILQQLLTNSAAFRDAIGIEMPEVESIVAAALPDSVLVALRNYRHRLDLTTLKVDPRDWAIVWLWDVTDSLIRSRDTLKKAMGPWNDDVLERIRYVTKMTHLTVSLKEQFLRELQATSDQ